MVGPSGGAPNFKVYPEKIADTETKTYKESADVLETIQSPRVQQEIVETLHSHGAIALIVPPQLDEAVIEDTCDVLTFHILMERRSLGMVPLAKLSIAISRIVHYDGLALPFDRFFKF